MLAQIDYEYIRTRPTKLISRLISYALFEGRPLTVSGQWINPAVFAQLSMWKWLPQTIKVKEPIFILGTGRSGTTILGKLLSMHKDVGFLNEPKAMWHTIYPHEDVIGNYDRGEANYRLNEDDVTVSIKQTAHKIFGGYLLSTLSSRVVDKYPELIFRVPFVRNIFPDARFIFLVRNGWDTCASIDSWSKKYGTIVNGEMHDWWGVNLRKWHLILDQLVSKDPYFANSLEEIRKFDRYLDMAAIEWVVTMREGLRVRDMYGDSIQLVKYEDLINTTDETLVSVLDFCGLPQDGKFMRYASKTLRKTEPHAQFKLHPAIQNMFVETLESLGYKA